MRFLLAAILSMACLPSFGQRYFMFGGIGTGDGSGITNASATTLFGSGTVPTARLGSGSATANTLLHGNQAYSAVVEADQTLSDVTTANVSTTKHGYAPKAPNDATKYLDGTGAYSVPPGGSGPTAGTNISVSGTAVSLQRDLTNLASASFTGNGQPGVITISNAGNWVILGPNDYWSISNATTHWTVAATNGGIIASSNIVAAAFYGDGSHLTGTGSGGGGPTFGFAATYVALGGGVNNYFPATTGYGGQVPNSSQGLMGSPLQAGTYTNWFCNLMYPAIGSGTNVVFILYTNAPGSSSYSIAMLCTNFGPTSGFQSAVGSNTVGSFTVPWGSTACVLVTNTGNNPQLGNTYMSWVMQKQ
jgi:hypothetical protein